MREAPPAPGVLSSLFPAPCLSAQWVENMAETQQVHAEESSNDESQEPRMSQSRRRFKASNMFFEEMVEMVDILKRVDHDGKYGPYLNPNVRKAKIMAKVVKSLHRNFGVRRSKDQLRKHWSDLKLREQDPYRRMKRVLKKGRKDSGHLRTPGTHKLLKK
ncbi:hypothetical protein AB205_0046500 [Aquarana catesbeiana]|uniref:Uncharacterized protein n=1 Tax=Aquarana catesbeiana TaxID=8400 RepID=A0A2G9QCB9_AQUCT|nr:hypothetical protein AB205_0046500 [Aquarana catesbeiana]